MNKGLFSTLAVAIGTGLLLWVSSCSTGGNPYPTIAFRIKTDSVSTQSSYVSLPHDTIFTLNINASKTGPDGLLKEFKITRNINGGPDSLLLNATVNTQYFSQFYSYKAGDSGTIETYTFTVGNADGYTSSIQFVDTVR